MFNTGSPTSKFFPFLLLMTFLLAYTNAVLVRTSLAEEGNSVVPNDAARYTDIGVSHFRNGDYLAAIPFFLEAVRIDPQNALYVKNLALTYHRIGDYSNAIALYTKALQLSPNDVGCMLSLANAHEVSGNTPAAHAIRADVEKLMPDGAFSCNQAGISHYNNGDYFVAIPYFRKARQIAPKSVTYAKNLADAYYHNSDFANAISQYREALRLAPYDVTCMEDLARAYDKSGDTRQAQHVREHIAGVLENRKTEAREGVIVVLVGFALAAVVVAGVCFGPLITRCMAASQEEKRSQMLLNKGRKAAADGPLCFKAFVARNLVSPFEVAALLPRLDVSSKDMAGLLQQLDSNFVGDCIKYLDMNMTVALLAWLPTKMHEAAMAHLFLSEREQTRARLEETGHVGGARNTDAEQEHPELRNNPRGRGAF